MVILHSSLSVSIILKATSLPIETNDAFMYVCIHICTMYACMYDCLDIRTMCACMYVCMHVSTYIRACVFIYVYTYLSITITTPTVAKNIDRIYI